MRQSNRDLIRENMNTLEIGGYLPLELNKTGEYYVDDVIRLNSARNAILLAAMDAGYKKLFVPIYLCPTVAQTLNNGGIDVSYYNIDGNFLPDINNSMSSGGGGNL